MVGYDVLNPTFFEKMLLNFCFFHKIFDHDVLNTILKKKVLKLLVFVQIFRSLEFVICGCAPSLLNKIWFASSFER